MNKFIAVMALAATVIPSSLLANTGEPSGETYRFTQRGVTYTYTIKPAAKGRQLIEGHTQDGAAFRLVVDGNRVQGVSGGQEVSFRTPTTTDTQFAAR